jgi:uncharacterized phiE125 gp8 family phage protein
MRIAVVTPPSAELITLAEAKAHLRIEALIASARQYVEAATNRALGLQTLEVQRRDFAHCMELPRPPLRNVVSVKYLDTTGAEQTLALSTYYRTVEHSDNQPGLLELKENVTLPLVYDSAAAVRIRYQAGLDTTGSPVDIVPAGLKQAMLLVIGDLYEHREAQVDAEIYNNPTVRAMLAPFKVWTL